MARYLLDTHTVLWWRSDDRRLPHRLDALLENTSRDHEILVSIVSIWEIAIKRQLGKLDLEGSLENFARTLTENHGFQLLPVEVPHLSRLEKLPGHHQDPFDRLLIAQAIEGGFTTITNDPVWKLYPVKIRW